MKTERNIKSRSTSKKMNTFEKVYKMVIKIPRGKVSTYGRIATYCGISNSKVVGYALHSNKAPNSIPCHRVVNIHGGLAKGYAFGGNEIQRQLLLNEGVTFIGGNVNLDKHLFQFK